MDLSQNSGLMREDDGFNYGMGVPIVETTAGGCEPRLAQEASEHGKMLTETYSTYIDIPIVTYSTILIPKYYIALIYLQQPIPSTHFLIPIAHPLMYHLDPFGNFT